MDGRATGCDDLHVRIDLQSETEKLIVRELKYSL